MKKLNKIAGLAVMFTALVMPVTASAAMVYGDVDGSGSVTPSDASLILRYIAGTETLDGNSLRAADADGNGIVSAADASAILRKAAGVIKNLPAESSTDTAVGIQKGRIREQILNGAEGEIHYSCYIPESYDGTRKYPMMVTMPGYDMMWFGESSSGRNIGWSGFRAWTELDEEMIVVSAQLTDWHEKSARQDNELAQYFVDNFAVDTNRIYAAGYSAGGETMSQAVSLRPDLYAAYLHGASQWDGTFAPIAENGVAVYVYMAENDEYYGSQKARDAYSGLYNAYRDEGISDNEINEKLHLEIPDNEYFNSRGIYNYHGGGNIVFDDKNVLNWIVSHTKQE